MIKKGLKVKVLAGKDRNKEGEDGQPVEFGQTIIILE